MIKVIDDYYIEVENAKGVINYTVRKGNFKTDAKGANTEIRFLATAERWRAQSIVFVSI